MKRKLKNLETLKLGRELSKSQQKKITGGVTVVCSGGTYPNLGGTCQEQMGYCEYAYHGTFISCTP